jgi:hypothetical protein
MSRSEGEEMSMEVEQVPSPGDRGSIGGGAEGPAEEEGARSATGLAVAAAGVSLFGFISLFRLRVDWDQSRGRAFRRFLGVLAESLTGIALGYRAMNRLRDSSSDRRGVPFAVVGIVLGASNVARAIFWLRQDRPEV